VRSARAISSWSNSLLVLLVATASAGPKHRDTPAPHVSSSAAPDGVPAIARKGEVVIVEVSESNGGGMPGDQRLEVRDKKDRVLQRIPLMSAKDYGKPDDVLEKRFEGINAKLQALHDKYDLVPMTALEVQEPEPGEEEHLVVGDGLDIEWKNNRLLVHPHGEAKVLAKAGDKSWLAKDTKSDLGGMCGHAVRLRGAFHAAGINAVVVDIEYRGTDSCWEPSGQWHVVSW